MTLIVEDGTIVANANTYVSAATLTSYATARGITLVSAPELLLIQAMDYLESKDFIGVKDTRDQTTEWPRFGAYIDGYPIDTNYIPQLLKDAQCEIAIAIDISQDPSVAIQPAVKTETVDVISVTYKDGGASTVINRKIALKLNKLLVGGGSAFVVVKG